MGKKLIEVEMEAEHLLFARHQLVENDRLRNGNGEALTCLRRKAAASKKSGPSPFRSVMKELRVQEIYKGEMPPLVFHGGYMDGSSGVRYFCLCTFSCGAHHLRERSRAIVSWKKEAVKFCEGEVILILAARAMISFITLTDNKSN